MTLIDLMEFLQYTEGPMSVMEVKDLALWQTTPRTVKCVSISIYGTQEQMIALHKELQEICPERDPRRRSKGDDEETP